MKATVFTDTVKNNYCVIDRITDNRQNGCDKYLVNFKSNSKYSGYRKGSYYK